MNVLIACEFSGVIRDAFRALGHDAWSCDLLDAEPSARGDGHIYHLRGDARRLLSGNIPRDMVADSARRAYIACRRGRIAGKSVAGRWLGSVRRWLRNGARHERLRTPRARA